MRRQAEERRREDVGEKGVVGYVALFGTWKVHAALKLQTGLAPQFVAEMPGMLPRIAGKEIGGCNYLGFGFHSNYIIALFGAL